MGLYLGGQKFKIILNGTLYGFKLYSALPTIKDILLSSSDDYLLKDFNGLYLTVKESE